MRFDGGIDLFFQFFVALVILEIEGSNLGEIGRAVRGGRTCREFPFSEKRESDPFMRPLVVSRSDESKKGSAISPRSPTAGQSNFLSFSYYARNYSLRQRRTSHHHRAFVKACVDRVNRRINVRDAGSSGRLSSQRPVREVQQTGNLVV